MDTITFMGKTYHKNRAGYYRSRVGGTERKLHVEVYKMYKGEIKEGNVIHHIDGNKDNNITKNLVQVTPSEHQKIHGNLEKYREERWSKIKSRLRTIICKECGKEVKATNTHQKFCSQRCCKRYNTRNKKRKYICQICNKEFVGHPYTHPKTCSSECAHELARQTKDMGNKN